MNILNIIQRFILLGIIVVVPFFFLPITAEFFVTQKAFLLLFAVLLSLVIVAVQIFVSGKVHLVKTPFGYGLLALLVIRAVSTFFASPNWMQALYAFPGGLMVLGSLTALYFLITHVSGVQREKIPVLSAFSLGALVASLTIVIFYFKPLANANLPQNLLFLKGQLSPIGNGLDTLVLLGFGLVMTVAHVAQRLKSGKHAGLVQSLLVVAVTAIALIMIGVLVFKPVDQQAGLRLPPFSISWYSALETLKTPKTALIGVGVDAYDTLFTRAKTAAYNATDLWTVNFAVASSTLLHVWAESGLLGLIAVLLVTIAVIRELHGLVIHKDKQALIYIVGGVYVGLLLLFVPPSYVSFFIMFIYLAALALQSMDHEHDPVREFSLKAHMPVYMGIAVILLAVAGSVGYFSAKVYESEIFFKKSIDAIRENNGQAVYQNLRRAVELQPRNERFRAQFAQVNLLLANNVARQAQPATGEAGAEGAEGAAPTELSDKDRQAIAQFVQQAIAEGKALVALNPQRASNWNTLAVIYRNIVNVAEGAQAWTVASYQEAIRLDPQNPQLRLNLGGVYYGAQQYAQAIQYFQQSVALKPNWANAQYNLSWAFYQNAQYAEAVAVMQNVLLLIEKDSQDYALAQENLKLFQEKLDEVKATGGVDGDAVGSTENPEVVAPDGEPDTEPLALPATPEAVLSPALKLPEGSGPEGVEPTPTPPAN